jgi:mono/diheme cytochrome c family protein
MNCFLKGAVVYSAVLFLLAALFLQTETARGALQRQKARRAKNVEELFNRNCARCHGADGRGDTPLGHLYNAPDFTDVEWWRKNARITNTRTLKSIVSRGKAGMPAFGKKLTRAEINLLVDRIRSFRKLERKI